MILRDYQQAEIKDFKGPWFSNIEATDVPLGNSLLAQNIRYLPGKAQKRFGFSSIQNPLDQITSAENWIYQYRGNDYNYLAYMGQNAADAGDFWLKVMDLSTGNITQISPDALNPLTKGISFAQSGSRLYYGCFSGTTNWGWDIPGVYCKETLFSSGPNQADPLYPLPLTLPILVDISGFGGDVTPGVHNFGYLLTTRSGFTGPPGPGNIIENPVPFTATNTNILQMEINPSLGTWPDWVGIIQAVMSPVDSPNHYYTVPGAVQDIAGIGGSTTNVQLIIDISDDDLVATGTDLQPATGIDQFAWASPTVNPTVLFPYSSRMVYVTATEDEASQSVLLISEPNAYQQLTLDQHAVYLPGQIGITTCFSLYNTLYVLGPHWTYQTADTGDVPATWPQPQILDSRIGTLSPTGATANAALGVAWVADTGGLYLFSGGSFQLKPVSYFQEDDWNRINWAAPWAVKVVDDKVAKKVRVIAPLDGATSPTHMLVWDYTQGMSAEACNYSLDVLGGDFPLGTGALVQNDDHRRVEFWAFPGDQSHPVVRENNSGDTNPYRDNGAAIDALYQTGLLPPVSGDVLQHHADRFRVQGAGQAELQAKTLDNSRTIPMAPITLAGEPGEIYLRHYHALSEGMTVQIRNRTLDEYFILSNLVHYFTPWVTNR